MGSFPPDRRPKEIRMIRQLHQPEEKQAVARAILEALPEWFGIPEAREDYIR